MLVGDFFPNFSEVLELADNKAKTSWEIEFVSNLRQKFFEWKEDTFLSEKQAKSLRRIIQN